MINRNKGQTLGLIITLLAGLIMLGSIIYDISTSQIQSQKVDYIENTASHFIVIQKEHKGIEIEEEVIYVDSIKGSLTEE